MSVNTNNNSNTGSGITNTYQIVYKEGPINSSSTSNTLFFVEVFSLVIFIGAIVFCLIGFKGRKRYHGLPQEKFYRNMFFLGLIGVVTAGVVFTIAYVTLGKYYQELGL